MKHTKAAAVVAGLIMALGMATPAMADDETVGIAYGSPGFLSGNVVQIPIEAQANICGNTVSVIGVLNPAVGNFCLNGD